MKALLMFHTCKQLRCSLASFIDTSVTLLSNDKFTLHVNWIERVQVHGHLDTALIIISKFICKFNPYL